MKILTLEEERARLAVENDRVHAELTEMLSAQEALVEEHRRGGASLERKLEILSTLDGIEHCTRQMIDAHLEETSLFIQLAAGQSMGGCGCPVCAENATEERVVN